MNGRRDESRTFGQHLALADVVALLDQGVRLLAEVLTERHKDFRRKRHLFERQGFGEGLEPGGMDSTPKALRCHAGYLLLISRNCGRVLRET